MGAEKKWLFTLFSASFLSVFFLLRYSISILTSPLSFPSVIHHGSHYPPGFAYYISGSRGDNDRVFRLLLAVYHPRNRYLLHLDADASDDDRLRLVAAVKSVPAVKSFGNVDVVGKPDRFSYKGASHVAASLRAAAILLKVDPGWNWFIALNAMDYPLITQDDMSHVFFSLNRDLNFLDHNGDLGSKGNDEIQPIVVDPALYLARRTKLFTATQKREVPDAFKVSTGSPWTVLSRSFLEYCVLGYDNLPRVLLMYFNNLLVSREGYYHSVACNAPEFKNTTVNSDLRYTMWDNPAAIEPRFLKVSDYDQMVRSGAAFAGKFEKNDHAILDILDEKILKRGKNRVTPGAWCSGRKSWWTDPCSQWGDVNVLRPGPQAKKFAETITNLIEECSSQSNQCK